MMLLLLAAGGVVVLALVGRAKTNSQFPTLPDRGPLLSEGAGLAKESGTVANKMAGGAARSSSSAPPANAPPVVSAPVVRSAPRLSSVATNSAALLRGAGMGK